MDFNLERIDREKAKNWSFSRIKAEIDRLRDGIREYRNELEEWEEAIERRDEPSQGQYDGCKILRSSIADAKNDIKYLIGLLDDDKDSKNITCPKCGYKFLAK